MVPQIKNMNIFYINLKKDLDRRQHFLKNEMGFDTSDIIKYVDKDDLLRTLINDSDYGEALNGYEGTYDEMTINGTEYVVMRTD